MATAPQPQRASTFEEAVDESTKRAWIRTLWSTIPDTEIDDFVNPQTGTQLSAYFRYFADQTVSPIVRRGGAGRRPATATANGNATNNPNATTRGRGAVSSHEHLLQVTTFLKANPSATRLKLITNLWPASLQDDGAREAGEALNLCVRLMFMISCRTSAAIVTTGQIFSPIWKDSETLDDFVGRVLPRHEIDLSGKSETIRPKHFRAQYLEKYAGIQIQWTSNIADHLHLHITERRKVLRLFSHAGFLETCSRALRDEDVEMENATALSLGCLHPDLISETLRSIRLIFPFHDPRSLKLLHRDLSTPSSSSSSSTTATTTLPTLDPRLAGPFTIHHGAHERPDDTLLPEDVRTLFERYPFWAERLYRLYREFEDPTPMTRLEVWSESRKSPRFTYWAGVIAISLAIFFGLTATALSAFQAWISWRSWKDAAASSSSGSSGTGN